MNERTTELLTLLAWCLEHERRLDALQGLQEDERRQVCQEAARILYAFMEAPGRVQRDVLRASRRTPRARP